MIRVILIDRVRLVCEVLGAVMQNESDLDVVSMATTYDDAVRALDEHTCDVALVSTSLPGNDALALVEHIRAEHPELKVLVMGVVDSEGIIMSYINAGAVGYVLREDAPQDLLANVRAAYDDKALVTPAIAARLMARIAELTEQLSRLGIEAADYEELTPREREILDLIGQGLTNQEIADKLVIELGTVKNHVHSILNKLNVNSRKDAALYLTIVEDDVTDET